ncbi:hypothetical protein Hanom_Chr06g00579571 [Helianthus anomalus]
MISNLSRFVVIVWVFVVLVLQSSYIASYIPAAFLLVWRFQWHLILLQAAASAVGAGKSSDIGIWGFTPTTPCIESVSTVCKRLVTTSVMIHAYPSCIIPDCFAFLKKREASLGNKCITKTRV